MKQTGRLLLALAAFALSATAQARDIAVLLHVLGVVAIDLRIHQVRSQIGIRQLLAERFLGLRTHGFEIDRRYELWLKPL